MSLSRVLLAVAAGFLLVSGAEASTVYKWTDDKGVVQYTDSPPEGRQFVRMQIGGAGARSDAAGAKGDAGADGEAAADGEATEEAASEGPSPAEQRLQTMKANCATARDNLRTLERFEVVTIDVDGDGKAETLDAAGREKAIADNKELVRQFCLD
jgi:hypothetical protein